MTSYANDYDERLNEVLAAMPATRKVIELEVGLRQPTVCRMVRALHEARWCHIGGWMRPAKGAPSPIYHAGPGLDRICQIKPITRIVLDVIYKRRLKTEEPDRWEKIKAKDRNRHWVRKAKTQGDPMVNALFGRVNPQQSKGGEA